MKPPPFLIGGGLLFWGWQTDFLAAGIVMAVVLEGARWLELRWEFSDDDFSRIWTFCTLLFLAGAVYAFTRNEGPSGFRNFFENPSFLTQRNAGTATARTVAALFRWVPMLFFLFVAAQIYNAREGIPLETMDLILGWRWRRARKQGQALPPSRVVNISYVYFALCLFAASIHSSEDNSFFWGLCLLLGWALWAHRSPRYGVLVWGTCLAAAIGLGYVGQRGLGHLQGYLGNLNPQWFAGFSRRRFDPSWTRTELGQIGRIKTSAAIVIRLETKNGRPPPLLREASYREFRRQTWNANTTVNDFIRVQDEPDKTTFVLLRSKTNLNVVSIGCYLERGKGLLPLPSGTGRLENLIAWQLEKSTLGAVLEEGPGLVVFDARYGPGETIDSPGTDEDRSVPERDKEALERIVAQLHLRDQTVPEAIKTLNFFFLRNFTYSLWQEAPRRWSRNESPITRFLQQTRRGHCEYFATAGVLLLRHAGIPARYAVGYAVHEGSGESYVVRQRDAHAWCLVWDKEDGRWRDFDPTPPSWVSVESERGSRFQALLDAWSWLSFQFSKFRWGQTNLRQYILWGLVPILAVLLYQIIARSRRRSRREREDSDRGLAWPGLDSEFYELERKLAALGLARQTSEPLSTWLERALAAPGLTELQEPVRELLRLHYRYRFDPRGLNRAEREELRREAHACLVGIRPAPVLARR